MESIAVRTISRQNASTEEIVKDAHALAVRIKIGVAVSAPDWTGVVRPDTDVQQLLRHIQSRAKPDA